MEKIAQVHLQFEMTTPLSLVAKNSKEKFGGLMTQEEKLTPSLNISVALRKQQASHR